MREESRWAALTFRFNPSQQLFLRGTVKFARLSHKHSPPVSRDLCSSPSQLRFDRSVSHFQDPGRLKD